MPEIPTSRFFRTNKPPAAPGACFVCRGVDGPFVDTRFDDRFLGSFYICKKCVAEFALILDVTENVNALAITHAYRRGIEDSLNKMRKKIDESLVGLIADIAVTAFSDPVTPDLPNREDAEGLQQGEEGGRLSTDATPVEGAGSTSVEGPVSISSDSGNGPDPLELIKF